MRAPCRAWLVLAAVCQVQGCSRTRGNDPSALVPDAAPVACVKCDDGVFCNGAELCHPTEDRCLPGERIDCDDDDECTLDSCDEALDRCLQRTTPRDDDGDGFDACDGDCDDQNAEVHPGQTELCDDRDEDCDGRADEGLRSQCGDCRPGCRLLYLPEPGTAWSPRPDNSDAVEVEGAQGPLVLSSSTRQRFDAWVANFIDGKVTKLDTRDGNQLARYDSVLRDGKSGAQPPDDTCDRDGRSDGGNCPSRTAVDLQGSVYVANRAFGNQGTITKIAGFEDDCIDRDDSGSIETSRDLNGNGQIDFHVEGEFLGQEDECLLWTVDVGRNKGVPRALAIAPSGSVWVGMHGESRVLELDPSNGDVISEVPVPGFRPYGAAIDSEGRLWLTEALTGKILAVDTEAHSAGNAISAPSEGGDCPSSYGIAVDPERRVWIAGFTCPFAFGYDPATKRWTSVALPDSGVTRGIAADDRGRIFVASSHDFVRLNTESVFNFVQLEASDPITRLTVFRASDGGDLRVFGSDAEPLPGRGAIGVGLDSEGRAWLVNQESSSATRVDVDRGEVRHFGVGDLPYTYSDFTGFALRRISAPTGFLREVLEGCAAGPTEWEELRVDAELPAEARVTVRLRTAPTRESLASARWIGPLEGDTIDLLADPGPLPEERFLEVEARLISSDRRSSPALRQIVVQIHCPL